MAIIHKLVESGAEAYLPFLLARERVIRRQREDNPDGSMSGGYAVKYELGDGIEGELRMVGNQSFISLRMGPQRSKPVVMAVFGRADLSYSDANWWQKISKQEPTYPKKPDIPPYQPYKGSDPPDLPEPFVPPEVTYTHTGTLPTTEGEFPIANGGVSGSGADNYAEAIATAIAANAAAYEGYWGHPPPGPIATGVFTTSVTYNWVPVLFYDNGMPMVSEATTTASYSYFPDAGTLPMMDYKRAYDAWFAADQVAAAAHDDAYYSSVGAIIDAWEAQVDALKDAWSGPAVCATSIEELFSKIRNRRVTQSATVVAEMARGLKCLTVFTGSTRGVYIPKEEPASQYVGPVGTTGIGYTPSDQYCAGSKSVDQVSGVYVGNGGQASVVSTTRAYGYTVSGVIPAYPLLNESNSLFVNDAPGYDVWINSNRVPGTRPNMADIMWGATRLAATVFLFDYYAWDNDAEQWAWMPSLGLRGIPAAAWCRPECNYLLDDRVPASVSGSTVKKMRLRSVLRHSFADGAWSEPETVTISQAVRDEFAINDIPEILNNESCLPDFVTVLGGVAEWKTPRMDIYPDDWITTASEPSTWAKPFPWEFSFPGAVAENSVAAAGKSLTTPRQFTAWLYKTCFQTARLN